MPSLEGEALPFELGATEVHSLWEYAARWWSSISPAGQYPGCTKEACGFLRPGLG
jgi:hypothetical protein